MANNLLPAKPFKVWDVVTCYCSRDKQPASFVRALIYAGRLLQ